MDFTIIKHAVEVDHGVKRFSMRFVKRYAAPERARLSAELCAEISANLKSLGLITVPMTLPTSENAHVWVIEKDSALGHVTAVASALAQLDQAGVSPLPQVFDNYPLAKANLS
ncbi:hypothetical protein [Streptomyces sp. NPDC006274]|jgi:hypothetical protein|uniref:hypothetical protein n=1 Tax=unclassified Streptomyces TaxID=2593676 RepID=UPI0033BEB0E0